MSNDRENGKVNDEWEEMDEEEYEGETEEDEEVEEESKKKKVNKEETKPETLPLTREVVIAELSDAECGEINQIEIQQRNLQSLIMTIGGISNQLQVARNNWVQRQIQKHQVEAELQSTLSYRPSTKQLIAKLPRNKNKKKRKNKKRMR